VPSLASDLDHAAPFVDQERDEAVAKVIGPRALQADSAAGGRPGVPVPGLPGGVIPDAARAVREQKRVVVRLIERAPPLGQVVGQRSQQANRSCLTGLGRLDAALAVGGLLDQQRPLAHIAPAQHKRLLRPQPGVGEQSDQRGIPSAMLAPLRDRSAQLLDREWR